MCSVKRGSALGLEVDRKWYLLFLNKAWHYPKEELKVAANDSTFIRMRINNTFWNNKRSQLGKIFTWISWAEFNPLNSELTWWKEITNQANCPLTFICVSWYAQACLYLHKHTHMHIHKYICQFVISSETDWLWLQLHCTFLVFHSNVVNVPQLWNK